MASVQDDNDVCTSNFKCTEKFVEGPVCKVFFKAPEDIDCHIPCLTQNCSFTFVRKIICERYDCIGVLSPAKFVNEHLPLIIGIGAFVIGFLLCSFITVGFYCRWKKRVAALEERRHLVEGVDDPNSTAPIVRNRPESHSRPISMHSLINLSSTDASIVPRSLPPSSPPPPAYNEVARCLSAAASVASINVNKPVNSYKESLSVLEVAYRNVRAKTPKDIFRPHETIEILITALIPASEVDQPRHDLINPGCECYECFLINLEQTLGDNEKEN